MSTRTLATACGIAALVVTYPVVAADAAGKAAAQAKCAQCHDAGDWDGESPASLESLIRDVARGAVSHKVKIQLNDAEVKDIAAYWAESGKKKK
jgi:mono/diheme cytochrome c family protein